jgi:hypothetical protein
MTQVERAVDTTETNSIRPFQYQASDEQLADLRRRIGAMKWPEQEPVPDASQGVQLATMQKLARYWCDGLRLAHVRSEAEALAAIHDRDRRTRHPLYPVRSKHDEALPLIVTHGWPGSILEQLKIIDPLPIDAQAGSASDASIL